MSIATRLGINSEQLSPSSLQSSNHLSMTDKKCIRKLFATLNISKYPPTKIFAARLLLSDQNIFLMVGTAVCTYTFFETGIPLHTISLHLDSCRVSKLTSRFCACTFEFQMHGNDIDRDSL